MSSGSGSGAPGGGPAKIVKASILAPSKFGGTGVLGGGSESEVAAPTVRTPFGGLKQSKLANLLRPKEEDRASKETDKKVETDGDDESGRSTTAARTFLPLTKGQSDVTPVDPLRQEKPTIASLPSKQPTDGLARGTSFPTANEEIPTPSDGFVFGENLSDRAANFRESPILSSPEKVTERKENGDGGSKEATEESSGAAVTASSAPTSPGAPTSTATTHKSLSEAAAEYCESLAPKRKYEDVKVVTGEEDERNVLQINARLHVFANSSWHERGRGCLRLNDVGQGSGESSRLVMRTAGSLRVILNTPIFAGMTLEAPTEKTVQLTGSDDGSVKVFLVTAAANDAAALFAALSKRRATAKSREDKEKEDEASKDDVKKQKLATD